MIKSVADIDFKGLKVLMRVDFNVPVDDNFNVTDETRIRAAVPSITKILMDGGAVILMSHFGRPKNGPDDKNSLKHILSKVSELLGVKVQFAADCIGAEATEKASVLKSGEVLLLENVRFYGEETSGDKDFAAKLAKLGDFYVNDAFGAAHRAHASTSIIAQYFGNMKAAGYLMAAELTNADKVIKMAEKPFTAIMGGAKVSDKIMIIENLLDKVDNLIVGGGMVFTFVKALGGKIGNSLCEEDKLDLALELIQKAKEKGVKMMFPVDSKIANAFSNEATTQITQSDNITDGWMGLDIGPVAIDVYTEVILNSKTILWNGPMGVFEMSNFESGTREIANAVAEATKNGAFSLIGGGDSAAAVNKFGLGDAVSFVSTGGGALLEYMEGKVLPGVSALEIGN